MPNITAFAVHRHHIYIPVFVEGADGIPREADAILDTGAPNSEFSDQFLLYAGLLSRAGREIQPKDGLQTQKYGKIIIPTVEICGHKVQDMTAYISSFEKSWGVDALIGLDFFRRFRVTIDYQAGQIATEPFAGDVR